MGVCSIRTPRLPAPRRTHRLTPLPPSPLSLCCGSYVSVNFLYNVLQLLITKHGGATLLVISAALALPVTNLAFKMRFIMGTQARPLHSISDVVRIGIHVRRTTLPVTTLADAAVKETPQPIVSVPLPRPFLTSPSAPPAGEDTEPFSWYDVVALAIVLLGFLVYSMMDDVLSTKAHKRMPIQFAPGSVIYIRERSNSDPSTPGTRNPTSSDNLSQP